MKMNLKGFIAGVMLGSIGISTVFAAPISKAINAVYSINAVTVDGRNIQFTEANRPFTVDGVTYLPVRAVAEALDKNVDYDSATATVSITSKEMAGGASSPASVQETVSALTADMVTGYDNNKLQGVRSVKNWDTKIKDNAGNSHTSGIEIYTNGINNSYNDATLNIALLGKYSNFKGQLVLTEKSKDFDGEFDVTILADDREIQTIHFKPGTLPQNLDLNVSNIQKLTFKFTETGGGLVPALNSVYYGLVDVALSK